MTKKTPPTRELIEPIPCDHLDGCGSKMARKFQQRIDRHPHATECGGPPLTDWHVFTTIDKFDGSDWWFFCPDCTAHYDLEIAARTPAVISEDPVP